MNINYTGIMGALGLEHREETGDEQPAAVHFLPEDLLHWRLADLPTTKGWQDIPVRRIRGEQGVILEGRFNDLQQIDSLSADVPRFWVALSSIGWNDSRFPVDCVTHPVVEMTYRCITKEARPALAWTYDGAVCADWLPHVDKMTTVARRLCHNNFPSAITGLTIRLFSNTRTPQSIEITALRMRNLSETEINRTAQLEAGLVQEHATPTVFPVLDSFLPLGVYMDAGSAKRLAEMMGISLDTYWDFVLEDILQHHHNCIALSEISGLSRNEWDSLLQKAKRLNIRILPRCPELLRGNPNEQTRFIEDHIVPANGEDTILGWSVCENPDEAALPDILKTRDQAQAADPTHPMLMITSPLAAYPVFAPHFAASGVRHQLSHEPWRVGEVVSAHAPLCRGQQFWWTAPTFVNDASTMEWSTCPEMRLMSNLAFANGAKGWFAYAYHNDPIWVSGVIQRTLTGPFLMFSDLWAELGQRMAWYLILGPLLLSSRPAEVMKKEFITRSIAHAHAQLPRNISCSSLYRLEGPNYNLHFVVSNDIHEMATVMIRLPAETMRGLDVYDLSDFMQTREWAPMRRNRHLEMFPGQAHLILVAEPKVCTQWRTEITMRMVEHDRKIIQSSQNLARNYNLNTKPIEKLIATVGAGETLKELDIMQQARNALINLIYASPPICDAKSKILEAGAALCGCDGNLCRLMMRGQLERAMELGLKVIPIAREITNLRMEMLRGRGATLLKQAESTARRASRLLAQIRSAI